MLELLAPTPHTRRGPLPALPASGAPVAVNANITRIFLSFDSGVVMLFDRPVAIDPVSPPTTWSFHGVTWIQAGSGFDFPVGTFFYLNGPVNPGDPVVIGADDPGARTPDGGYVNGGSFTVEDI